MWMKLAFGTNPHFLLFNMGVNKGWCSNSVSQVFWAHHEKQHECVYNSVKDSVCRTYDVATASEERGRFEAI